MGHPDLKLPAGTPGFIPNQHRRRVSLPATPPETPANFTGFFPKGAGTIPAHLGGGSTFSYPISPPATPTRPQTLPSESLPTHTHQRLPSYDEKLRRASWAPHHRRVSTTSLLRVATHATRPLLNPTKLATLLLIILSGTYLVSLVAFPSRTAPIVKSSPVVAPREPPRQARPPMKPLKFGNAGNRHLADERERKVWAEGLPEHMPHQIHVVPVVDKPADVEMLGDVIREHPESFQGQRPAMRLRPGQSDIVEDEAAIADQVAEPEEEKPAFYIGGKAIYKQRQKGPERVQIGKAAEAPVIVLEDEPSEAESDVYTEAAEAQEAERLEDSGISMPPGGGTVEEVEVEVEELPAAAEEEEVEEVAAAVPVEAEEEEEVEVPVQKVVAKKPAMKKPAVKKPLLKKPTAKRPTAPVAAPAAPIVEPPARVPHEAEVAREKILAGLGARPQRARLSDQQQAIQRMAMVKQINAAKAGAGGVRGMRHGPGALDSSSYRPPPDLEKDPRDSKRKVMKNPIRRKGAGKARVSHNDGPDFVAAAVKKASRPVAEEWRNINGDEDEGDEVAYRR